MRSLILTFFLLFASLAGASGSNTVFQKINRYWVTTNLSQMSHNAEVSPYLQSLERQVYIIKMSRSLWLKNVELLRSGKQLIIQFGSNRPITFYYEPTLKIVYGQTRYGDLVILDPCDDETLNYYLQ